MKVRVIKTPTMGYGGNLYDRYSFSPGELSSLGEFGNQFVQGAIQTLGTVNYVSGVPKITPYEYRPLNKTKNWDVKNTQVKPVDRIAPYSDYFGQPVDKKSTNSFTPSLTNAFKDLGPNENMLFRGIPGMQNGGNTSSDTNETKAPVDPQLLQAYRVIGEALGGGQDPNALVDEFVKQGGLSMEDATSVVQKVMEYLKPTNEEGIPMAQMGMNNGMFAGQSMESNVIKKPLMKDGGHTFVTSQPAYTQKSHNYFGTSNAPARDSYTDNEQVTTSVKAVPREDATIEAEKGEYIFSDRGLYRIEGKKHSQGGTPLAAKGGEFIFSAHRDMSLDHDLQKKSGLKVGSSKALAENTPAKVLERNVDVKEYNRLKTILESPKSDAITKKTAQFMLDKMNIKIDLIAKLQEAKKQPAPTEVQDQYLEQSETQKDIDEQKQYAYGGDTGLPMYQKDGEVKWIKDEDGNIVQQIESEVTEYDPSAQTNTSPYTGTAEEQAKQRLARVKKWYDVMYEKGYRGPDPSDPNNYDPTKPNTIFPAIGQLQEYTAKTYPEYIRQYLYSAQPSQTVQKFINAHGKKPLKDINPSDPELLTLFKDQMFDWRLPIAFNKKKTEYKPWNPPAEKPKDIPEPKKPYTSTVSDINIPDPYEQVKAMQFSQYANNVLNNKPYFTYTPAINQPWTIAPKQSTQPLENQAGLSRRIASRVGSRLQDAGAMQDALAKENDAVNDAFFKVGQYNAEQEAQNYNQNLLRNSAAVNQFNQNLKQTHDLNSNVLDKMNFNNAAYYNQYSTARQKDMLNRYYNQRDLLTTMIPYLDTYEVENPNGTITKHMTTPINVLTGEANPQWSGWNSTAVKNLAGQESEEDRLKTIQQYKNLNLSPEEINYIRTGKFGK